jgi:hypothetical protein
MTLPGVSYVTAIALLGAIGDVRRLRTARHLVGYLGLDPRVRQSGNEPAKHGKISKQGPGDVRGLLVEAAWHAARSPGPLRAFHQRIATRRGANVATVAVARELALIVWHLLSRGEDYAFVHPTAAREDPPPGTHARRAASAGPPAAQQDVPATRPAPGRKGAGRTARARLSPTGRRLAGRQPQERQGGRGRDTGARIS